VGDSADVFMSDWDVPADEEYFNERARRIADVAGATAHPAGRPPLAQGPDSLGPDNGVRPRVVPRRPARPHNWHDRRIRHGRRSGSL